ncbi:hypothetical protein LEMLEM_LOCUS348 [Lemmus lemmus]
MDTWTDRKKDGMVDGWVKMTRSMALPPLETACSCHRALAQAILFIQLPPPHAYTPHSLTLSLRDPCHLLRWALQ